MSLSTLTRTVLLRRKTRLSPISAKRKVESAIYLAKRKAFLKAHPFCQVSIAEAGLKEADVIRSHGWFTDPAGIPCKMMAAIEVHHRCGRIGTNYLNTRTWMAVSAIMHDWLHRNPKLAREKGYLKT